MSHDMAPAFWMILALALLNGVLAIYNETHAASPICLEPRANGRWYRLTWAVGLAILILEGVRALTFRAYYGIAVASVAAMAVLATVNAMRAWSNHRQCHPTRRRWASGPGRHIWPRLALLILPFLGGCQFAAGHDGKGACFVAGGLLTTPELARAKVGEMTITGYSRGNDVEAMQAIVGAAVKAAVTKP